MDYDDTPQEAAFRAEFRTWLRDNDPGPEPPPSDSVAEHAFRMAWHRQLYQGGWLGLSWPEQWGGRGLSPLLEAIINEELGVAGIPNSVGPLGWLGRALLLFGNDDQRERFLMPLLKGESQWCQGFSEPGAGSDLAGISTYAARDGASYRITGQKLWTSGAQFAEWCMVLVKTDRTIAKHKGISCFVIAMDTPGITVRTLKQSWGGERFCEVFFDEAEAFQENRLGDEGDGWKLANTVLSYERGPSEIGVVATWKSELARLAVHTHDNPSIATKYAATKVAVEACRLRLMESLSKRSIGEPPGPGSSIDKLLMIRAEQALGSLEMDVAQASGVTGGNGDAGERYIYSRAASIYGGTEQIQKNIVAQRILGLPRSMVAAGVDKRTELIAKAVTIFSAKGFRGTSMNQIAEAGGIHKSTLYHYFTGKEDLLVEIYGDVLGANVLAAERILASDQPTGVKLRAMLVDRVVYTCTNRRILQIFFEEETELPKRLLTRVYEERKAYVGVMSGLIEQGVDEGIFAIDTNPTIVVNTFLGATNWIYKWYEPRGSKSPAELGEEITELLLRSVSVK